MGFFAGVLGGLLESEDPEMAKEAYQVMVDAAQESDNLLFQSAAMDFEACIRRLNLVGNELELTGTYRDGSQFRWEPLKGKVVLVDFWATWCKPCVGEMPSLLAHYEKYHDKGFEIVGVSLDQDREALEQFLQQNDIPWKQILDPANPALEKYGIRSFPTVILIGRDGRVTSINARGEELEKLLAELLDP